MRKVLEVIWGVWEQKYFCKQDWTASIRLIPFKKSPTARTAGLTRRVRAKRGPMTDSGVTHRFIVSERRMTLRQSARG
jgi:hypothetical protein